MYGDFHTDNFDNFESFCRKRSERLKFFNTMLIVVDRKNQAEQK